MKVQEYIQNTFRQRAERAGALVIYDPDQRFRSLVLGLANEKFIVIDATGAFIEAHEAAVEEWTALGRSAASERRLLVYVPMPPPKTPEARCHEPFSGIAAGADWFPRSDNDNFQTLCEMAKPEHREKIRELFATGTPDIATIDAAGGGTHWPLLQTLLGAESTAEIILAILVPSSEQQSKLKKETSWITEAKELFGAQLVFSPKGKSWESISNELWRFVLFSEFVLDLPGPLPQTLSNVAHAPAKAKTLINRVCDGLRQERHHTIYITRADQISRELSLEERMRGIEELGERDTFAFEERSFLQHYVKALLGGSWAEAAKVADQRRESVWVKHTERGMLWTVAERARELLVAALDLERELPGHIKSTDSILNFYATRGYRLDQACREMEKAFFDAYGDCDGLEDLIETARKRFRAACETMQQRFIEAVSKSGWPVNGFLRGTQVFDKTVGPLLESRGKRVVFMLIDALRFELGVALEKQLATHYTCRLQPVCAQLPTVTAIGMASLLPKADGNLNLKNTGDELTPYLGNMAIKNPADRVAYVQQFFGDRVRMLSLDELLKRPVGAKKKSDPLTGIELLLVHSTDIDEQGEIDAANVCRILPHALGGLINAVGKLKKLGFHHVVIATDHGFVLHGGPEAGDTVNKPAGDWIKVKDRCMLGHGSASVDTILFPKEHVGIHGDFQSYLVPRSLGTFNKRHPYFHEGLSLQEAVTPLLQIDLGNEESSPVEMVDVQLRYRGEITGTVTTWRPVLDVSVFGGELFSSEVTFRLEARSKAGDKERVVGEAASCAYVDPATGVVRVKAGQAVKIPLRILDEFTGAMEVRAVDAETGVIYGSALTLTVEIQN